MKMNRNEMEALYAFGCPNLKATVERLRMVAALAPDPVAKKLFYMFRKMTIKTMHMSNSI